MNWECRFIILSPTQSDNIVFKELRNLKYNLPLLILKTEIHYLSRTVLNYPLFCSEDIFSVNAQFLWTVTGIILKKKHLPFNVL